MSDNNEILVSQAKLQQKHNTKRLKESLKKKKSITMRVSEDQQKKIKEMAQTEGKSLSQFMINRAFEHPNFDKSVVYGIRNMDWLMNDMKRQEKAIVEKWRAHQQFETKDIDNLFDSIVLIEDNYHDLKSALYKTYLTDIEAQKLTEQEKKNKEIDRQERLVKLHDKIRGEG